MRCVEEWRGRGEGMGKEKKKIKTKKRRWNKDDTELTLLALPTTIWYFLFCFMPMFGIVIAFKKFKINGGFLKSFLTSEWVGFDNFKFLFSTKDIWMIIKNTLAYNIVFIILGIVVPVAAAIAIGQLHSGKLTKIYQTAMFMPYFLSWVVVTALVWAFLSYDKGLVNNMLETFGMERQQWYMKPVIILMFIMNVGRIFYSDFGLFYQVPRDSNSLYDVVYTLDVYVYKQLKSSTTGMSAAAAFIQSVAGCITILTANAVVRKIDKESAMI